MIRRLAVFLGSHDGTDPALVDATYRIGQSLAERDIELVYGGGAVGLMGHLSKGVIDGGGQVYGVIPRFMVDREWGRIGPDGSWGTVEPGVATHVVETMHERKAMMTERADAFLTLPGGLGTLEELFEVWTWQTLGLHAKPVGLLNLGGFWDPLVAMIEQVRGAGFLRGPVADQLVVGDDLDDVLHRLSQARGDG